MTTYKIGDFSKLCRVPVSALRFYADIGLLEPERVDKFTGYRYYSAGQLPRLNRILALRDLGFSLEEIGRLLDDNVSAETLRGMLMMKQVEIERRVSDEQARLLRVAARISQIAGEGQMSDQDVLLKQIDAMRVLAIREVVGEPTGVGDLLRLAAETMIGQGVMPVSPPFTLFHDVEFAETDLDVEIALPVAGNAPARIPFGDGRALVARELPAVAEAASIIHTGSYDTLEQTYLTIGRWIELNGYVPDGPVREMYLRPHMGEDEGITEIQFPVRRAV